MPTIETPKTVAQFGEIIRNSVTREALLRSGQFDAFTHDYAKAIAREQPGIARDVGDQHASVLGLMGLDPSYTPQLTNRADVPTARGNGVFANLTELFQAGYHGHLSTRNELNSRVAKMHLIRAAYGSQVPADGGFLIPEEFRSEMLGLALEASLVRSRATIIPMSGLRTSIPAVSTDRTDEYVFGGLSAAWREEGEAYADSNGKFDKIALQAKSLGMMCDVPNELVSDAPAFGQYLKLQLPQAIAWFEDKAYFSGTGVKQPLGWQGHGSEIVVSKRSGQVADTIVLENILDMYSRMLPSSLSRAVWIASYDTFPEIATMAIQLGLGANLVWINNAVDGPPARILGRPVIFTEKVPKLGDAGDLSFVDFGHYLIGDRQVMTIDSSPHFKFGNGVTTYRLTQRVDGRPWLTGPVSTANGGPTLSPFVRLGERA